MPRRVTALVLVVLGWLTACGAQQRDDRAFAQRLADRVVPGELTVFDVRSRSPASSGSEVRFAVRDDPDAVVTLAVDSGVAGRECEDAPCERQLADALAFARAQAGELRLLLDTFGACGYPIVAVDRIFPAPPDEFWVGAWVAAAVTNDTISTVVADLDACIGRWRDARAAAEGTWPERRPVLTLGIVAPSVPPPSGDLSVPTVARLADPKQLAALTESGYHTAVISTPGSSIAGTLRPVLPYERQQAFERDVEELVRGWLATSDLSPRPTLPTVGFTGAWSWLLPGRADRLRAYVQVCTTPSDERRCRSDAAVALTVALEDTTGTDFRLIQQIRGPDGLFRYPLEPH